MKKIQKGFTLIELMIVVAIIGILAAVAIPAYQDYIVKAKLSKVVSTLDPVKTALAMYFQEQGGFPVGDVADYVGGPAGLAPASLAAKGSVWASLGFGNVPSLPNEVYSMALHSMKDAAAVTSTNIAIVLQLQNVKAGSVDGVWIAISPNFGGNVAGVYIEPRSMVTTNLATTDTISGASAINWYYGCDKGVTTAGKTDAVVKNFFKNGNTVLTCV